MKFVAGRRCRSLFCPYRANDEEIVAALDRGADDYVVKPFNVDVLMARINANLRKAAIKEAGEPLLINGPIRMDLVRHEVFIEENKAAFTPKEYELLRYFMVNRGKMLTHKQILKEIWGPAHGEDTQYVRVYIGQLREKLETDPANPRFIMTEPGIGYRMEVLPDSLPKGGLTTLMVFLLLYAKGHRTAPLS